jgi:superfamily I DNA and/or RNA helicase
VHRFQGGERDIMLISPVGGNGIAQSTRNWLVSQADLWNVAITRA